LILQLAQELLLHAVEINIFFLVISHRLLILDSYCMRAFAVYPPCQFRSISFKCLTILWVSNLLIIAISKYSVFIAYILAKTVP